MSLNTEYPVNGNVEEGEIFRLQFRKSKSKFYKEVVELAGNFSYHFFKDNCHVLTIGLKEIFEKWDFFNLLFWKVVDWKGTTFGYGGYDMHSHSDKTRFFYALQWAHSTWINMSVDYLRKTAPAYYNPNESILAKFETMKDYNILDFEKLILKALDVYGER